MYIFERDILHSLYWGFYFEKKLIIFAFFDGCDGGKNYKGLHTCISVDRFKFLFLDWKKFLCNKFRNEEILIYFIDYKYMHTLLHHMHTLELLLNAVTTGPLSLAKLWTDAWIAVMISQRFTMLVISNLNVWSST